MASTTGIQLFDGRGQSVVHEVFSMDMPALATSGLHSAFYDIGGTALRLVDPEGNYTVMDTENSIISVDMNENGWMAVAAEEPGYKGSVTVYNAELVPVYEWHSARLTSSGSDLTPDNSGMAVLSADSSGGESDDASFDSEKEKGVLSAPGELLLDCHYLNSDSLCAISEEGCFSSTGDCREKGSYDFGDLYLTDYEWDGTAF